MLRTLNITLYEKFLRLLYWVFSMRARQGDGKCIVVVIWDRGKIFQFTCNFGYLWVINASFYNTDVLYPVQ